MANKSETQVVIYGQTRAASRDVYFTLKGDLDCWSIEDLAEEINEVINDWNGESPWTSIDKVEIDGNEIPWYVAEQVRWLSD